MTFRTALLLTAALWLSACAPTAQNSESATPAPAIPPADGVSGPVGNVTTVSVATDGNHSVNTHFVRGDDGWIAVDAQWRLPDAETALSRANVEASDIVAVLVTHPHTDHYGGLPTFVAGGAPVLMSHGSAASIRTDAQGFQANREEQFGPDFPDSFPAPERTFGDGETLQLGGRTFEVMVTRQDEAVETATYYLPDERALLTGDLVQNETLPFLLQGGVDGWIDHLDRLRERFPDAEIVFPGHGRPGPAGPMIATFREVLVLHRDLIQDALSDDGAVSEAERAAIIAGVIKAYPEFRTTAGVPTREEVISIGIDSTLANWQIASAREEG